MTEDNETRHLREAIQNLSQVVRDLTVEIRKEYLRKEVYNSDQKALQDDIDSLNKSRAWIAYLVIGIVVSSMVGLVISVGIR